MFNGIIEELGQVKRISKRGNNAILEVKIGKAWEEAGIGDSVSVNGACLTVVKNNLKELVFEIMPETQRATNLGSLCISDKVNLERSLKVGERISGHFVTGHVDCLGLIRKKKYLKGNLCFEIAIPQGFSRYCLPKGSIAVDGISLTLAENKADTFSVYIIPHTLKNTTLGFKGPSDKVNLEFDILAKRNPAP